MSQVSNQKIKEEDGKETFVNGVSVTKLLQSTEAVKNDTALSKFKFQAKGKWIFGAHIQTSIDDYYGASQTYNRAQPFVYDGDEPAVLFGTDLAANPLEYVLVALNGCLTTALVYNASAQGIYLEEVESTLEGNMDVRGAMGLSKEVRNGYENIKVSFRVKSSAPKEKIKELIEVAQMRSPVFDILSNPTPIEVTLQE
jgi:uncharacterized OsmC-like protein